MKALELLNLANTAYPHGYLAMYYHHDLDKDPDDPQDLYKPSGSGDTIADCIVIELLNTYRENPEAPDAELLEAAVHQLERLAEDISDVAQHLHRRREELLNARHS
jgi:hypothetical protein